MSFRHVLVLIPITLSAIGCSGKKEAASDNPADTVTTTTSTTIPEFTITTTTLPLSCSEGFTIVNSGCQKVISKLYASQNVSAIKLAGINKGFGNNSNAQIVNPSSVSISIPTKNSILNSFSTTVNFYTVAAATTCASDGSIVKCVGYGGTGQLGNGSTSNSTTPVDVSHGLSNITAMYGGYGGICVTSDNSNFKCWGLNNRGQLGSGNTTNLTSPTSVTFGLTGVTKMAMGNLHTCVTDGSVIKCVGGNAYGQLGDGTITDSTTPVTVIHGLSGTITTLVAGGYTTCASDGVGVKCWGNNSSGQLGTGDTNNSSNPVATNHGLTGDVTKISVGLDHICVATNTKVSCIGDNSKGQLGDGTGSGSSMSGVTIIDSSFSNSITDIASGYYHTCVTDGVGLKCWGLNSTGQIGDGTTTQRNSPVDILF